MSYTVYENRPENTALVHRAGCSYVGLHGGGKVAAQPDGQYYEGYATVEAAVDKALSTDREVRICRRCKPPVSL